MKNYKYILYYLIVLGSIIQIFFNKDTNNIFIGILLAYSFISTMIDCSNVILNLKSYINLKQKIEDLEKKIIALESMNVVKDLENKRYKDLYIKVASGISPKDHKEHYKEQKKQKQNQED